MRRPVARAAAALALGSALSGCVAAAIAPVVAAGAIGKKRLDGDKPRKPRRSQPASQLAAAAPAVQADTAVRLTEGPARSVTPALTDSASLENARLTLLPSGSALPPPDGSIPASQPAPVSGWRALVRHVAQAMSSGATCPAGQTTVLVDAAVSGAAAPDRDAAVTSLNALRTMGARVTFVSADPKTARTALAAAAMAEPDTRIAAPAEVAAIARSGCVIASGGGARGAYTGLTWFALPDTTPSPAAKADR